MRDKTRQEKVSEIIGVLLLIISVGFLIFFMTAVLDDVEPILDVQFGDFFGSFLCITMVFGTATMFLIICTIINDIFIVNEYISAEKKFSESKKAVRRLYRKDKITKKEKKIRYRLLEIIKLQDEIKILKAD